MTHSARVPRLSDIWPWIEFDSDDAGVNKKPRSVTCRNIMVGPVGCIGIGCTKREADFFPDYHA